MFNTKQMNGSKMTLNWFKSNEAVDIGAALADEFSRSAAAKENAANFPIPDPLEKILQHADSQVRGLRLNFFKRAKFANSFKWRLIENGVDKGVADELTQKLIVHLAVNGGTTAEGPTENGGAAPVPAGNPRQLLARGHKLMSQGANADAIPVYQAVLDLDPNNASALNNLGAALFLEGRYKQAEECFRHAIKTWPNEANGYANLGSVLRSGGYYAEGETHLRRALKLNPTHTDARVNLGLTLATLNRLRDAKAHFDKVLKAAPRHAPALNGLATIARTEGRFQDAESLTDRALEADPKLAAALAAKASMRTMTVADSDWLERAEEATSAGMPPIDQADLRFAIGKYYDDLGEYKQAFRSYESANQLLMSVAEKYDRDAHRTFVDGLVSQITPARLAQSQPGASKSAKPVFVVGMPRSGTSLVEQIIASHPSAKGAGELAFWADTVRDHGEAIIDGSLSERARIKLAEDYLRELESKAGDALRIVDKAPINADYLGMIHPLLPNAHIVYVRRDPIDTCLSCYFQRFLLSLNYTMDLEDLAHYYRQHHRLMAHWRTTLPPGTILDVPYEELVADQAGWTRKILDFLGLEWDDRCLEFHKTRRPVATSSFWQVRQKMYTRSVARWRHYEKFIGPLLGLKKIGR